MKKCIYIITAALLIGMTTASCCLWTRNKSLAQSLSTAKGNEKALLLKSDSLNEKARVLRLTAEQLEYCNDSIMESLRQAQNSLKIKDKNLRGLQYMASTATRTDTVCFRDTIFRDRSADIDTTLTDKRWYALQVSLKYPDKIIVSPSFTSEKHVIISSRKETVNPPKKFFLFRWFQKKHTVIEADVVEKNPYIQNKENRFIEVIK